MVLGYCTWPLPLAWQIFTHNKTGRRPPWLPTEKHFAEASPLPHEGASAPGCLPFCTARILEFPFVQSWSCCAGSSFNAEDLKSLQLGDMKTKMLLSSLTKLGKLHVQVDHGRITGYHM